MKSKLVRNLEGLEKVVKSQTHAQTQSRSSKRSGLNRYPNVKNLLHNLKSADNSVQMILLRNLEGLEKVIHAKGKPATKRSRVHTVHHMLNKIKKYIRKNKRRSVVSKAMQSRIMHDLEGVKKFITKNGKKKQKRRKSSSKFLDHLHFTKDRIKGDLLKILGKFSHIYNSEAKRSAISRYRVRQYGWLNPAQNTRRRKAEINERQQLENRLRVAKNHVKDELLRMIGKLSHSSAKRSQIIRHNEEFRPIIGTTAVHRNYLDTKASKRSWMYKNEEFERHLHGRGYFSRKERRKRKRLDRIRQQAKLVNELVEHFINTSQLSAVKRSQMHNNATGVFARVGQDGSKKRSMLDSQAQTVLVRELDHLERNLEQRGERSYFRSRGGTKRSNVHHKEAQALVRTIGKILTQGKHGKNTDSHMRSKLLKQLKSSMDVHSTVLDKLTSIIEPKAEKVAKDILGDKQVESKLIKQLKNFHASKGTHRSHHLRGGKKPLKKHNINKQKYNRINDASIINNFHLLQYHAKRNKDRVEGRQQQHSKRKHATFPILNSSIRNDARGSRENVGKHQSNHHLHHHQEHLHHHQHHGHHGHPHHFHNKDEQKAQTNTNAAMELMEDESKTSPSSLSLNLNQGNKLGESVFEDITDSHTHGLKISAFDKGRRRNTLKSREDDMKDVERDHDNDDESTLKAGKDSEMEEEIEDMVVKSEKVKPSVKKVCRPRSRSIIDRGIQQMRRGFNPNALTLQRIAGYQIGNESFLGFEKRSSVQKHLGKDEIESPEDIRLIKYVKMNNLLENDNTTEMAEDCEGLATKSNEEAIYSLNENEKKQEGSGSTDDLIGGEDRATKNKEDVVTKEEEELAFGGLANEGNKDKGKWKKKQKSKSAAVIGKHEVLREKHGPRSSLKNVEDGLLEGEEKTTKKGQKSNKHAQKVKNTKSNAKYEDGDKTMDEDIKKIEKTTRKYEESTDKPIDDTANSEKGKANSKYGGSDNSGTDKVKNVQSTNNSGEKLKNEENSRPTTLTITDSNNGEVKNGDNADEIKSRKQMKYVNKQNDETHHDEGKKEELKNKETTANELKGNKESEDKAPKPDEEPDLAKLNSELKANLEIKMDSKVDDAGKYKDSSKNDIDSSLAEKVAETSVEGNNIVRDDPDLDLVEGLPAQKEEKSGACLHNNKRKGTLNCGWRGKAARKKSNHTTYPLPEAKKLHNSFPDEEQLMSNWGIESENTLPQDEHTNSKPNQPTSYNATQNDLNEFTSHLKDGWSLGTDDDDLNFGQQQQENKGEKLPGTINSSSGTNVKTSELAEKLKQTTGISTELLSEGWNIDIDNKTRSIDLHNIKNIDDEGGSGDDYSSASDTSIGSGTSNAVDSGRGDSGTAASGGGENGTVENKQKQIQDSDYKDKEAQSINIGDDTELREEKGRNNSAPVTTIKDIREMKKPKDEEGDEEREKEEDEEKDVETRKSSGAGAEPHKESPEFRDLEKEEMRGEDGEELESVMKQHRSGREKELNDAELELVEGIRQHNSVRLDLSHKHGENVEEFGESSELHMPDYQIKQKVKKVASDISQVIGSLSSDTKLAEEVDNKIQKQTLKKIDEDITRVIDSLSSDRKLVRTSEIENEGRKVKKIDDEIRQMQNDIVIQPDKSRFTTEEIPEESNVRENVSGSDQKVEESELLRKGHSTARKEVPEAGVKEVEDEINNVENHMTRPHNMKAKEIENAISDVEHSFLPQYRLKPTADNKETTSDSPSSSDNQQNMVPPQQLTQGLHRGGGVDDATQLDDDHVVCFDNKICKIVGEKPNSRQDYHQLQSHTRGENQDKIADGSNVADKEVDSSKEDKGYKSDDNNKVGFNVRVQDDVNSLKNEGSQQVNKHQNQLQPEQQIAKQKKEETISDSPVPLRAHGGSKISENVFINSKSENSISPPKETMLKLEDKHEDKHRDLDYERKMSAKKSHENEDILSNENNELMQPVQDKAYRAKSFDKDGKAFSDNKLSEGRITETGINGDKRLSGKNADNEDKNLSHQNSENKISEKNLERKYSEKNSDWNSQEETGKSEDNEVKSASKVVKVNLVKSSKNNEKDEFVGSGESKTSALQSHFSHTNRKEKNDKEREDAYEESTISQDNKLRMEKNVKVDQVDPNKDNIQHFRVSNNEDEKAGSKNGEKHLPKRPDSFKSIEEDSVKVEEKVQAPVARPDEKKPENGDMATVKESSKQEPSEESQPKTSKTAIQKELDQKIKMGESYDDDTDDDYVNYRYKTAIQKDADRSVAKSERVDENKINNNHLVNAKSTEVSDDSDAFQPSLDVEGNAYTMGEGDEDIQILPNHKEEENIKEEEIEKTSDGYSSSNRIEKANQIVGEHSRTDEPRIHRKVLVRQPEGVKVTEDEDSQDEDTQPIAEPKHLSKSIVRHLNGSDTDEDSAPIEATLPQKKETRGAQVENIEAKQPSGRSRFLQESLSGRGSDRYSQHQFSSRGSKYDEDKTSDRSLEEKISRRANGTTNDRSEDNQNGDLVDDEEEEMRSGMNVRNVSIIQPKRHSGFTSSRRPTNEVNDEEGEEEPEDNEERTHSKSVIGRQQRQQQQQAEEQGSDEDSDNEDQGVAANEYSKRSSRISSSSQSIRGSSSSHSSNSVQVYPDVRTKIIRESKILNRSEVDPNSGIEDNDVMLDHDMQAKLAKELENHPDGGDKVLTIKFRHKGKVRHHPKHHLATDQVGMLGNDLGMKMHEMHENAPELEKAPVEDEDPHSRDDDEQAKELERIKGEANKLLAAQRKIKQEKLAEKERHEAEKLLETEKKIKEEEQKEMRKHHKKKKKKAVVHKAVTKGTATSSFLSHRPKMKEDDIPFLNEDPYPLSDFVTEYDKTVAYGRNALLRRRHGRKMNENMLNYNDRTYNKLDDSLAPSDSGRKKYNLQQRQRDDLDYKIDSSVLNRNDEHHPLLRRFDTQDSDKRHLNIHQYDIKPEETDDETIDDIDDDKYESTSNVTPTDVAPSPILNEKDGITGKPGVAMLSKDTKKENVVENNSYDKSKIKPDIDNMIDKAFGEVLDTK